MEVSKILYDYKEICQIIPENVIKLILSKGTDDTESKKYVDISIIRNQKDWLWRSFIKFIMPFQMKSTKDGKRKMSFAGSLYMTFLIMFLLSIIFLGFLKYVMILAWVFVVGKTIMPWIMAFVKLLLNKNYYRTVLRGGIN